MMFLFWAGRLFPFFLLLVSAFNTVEFVKSKKANVAGYAVFWFGAAIVVTIQTIHEL